jgi:hypothetical protein
MPTAALAFPLTALAVLVAAFYAFEAALGTLLARRLPGYAQLAPAQWRVRAFETLASAYLCAGGVAGACAHAAAGLNYVSGHSAFARVHCLLLAAFYGFHLWRMAAAKGYPRALYPHHAFMTIGLVCCLYYDVLYFYALLSAVPAGGACVRNARWAARASGGAVPLLAPRAAAALLALVELPAPLFGFFHLFAFGLRDGRLPGLAWALVIAPAVASTTMAAWFVASAWREAARRPLHEGA